LAKVFYFAGFIESWGRGTIKIVENCVKQGLPEPDFVEESGVMKVVFYKDKFTKEFLQKMGLNERQIKAVMYVKEKGRITNKEYRKLTGLSDEGARIDLSELSKKGLLQPKGKGRNAHYVLGIFGD
jgi:ATP-dependent DNA helicase RecG